MLVKLGDVGTIITGKTPSTKNKENFDGEIRFITPEDISYGFIIKDSKRHISPKGFDSICTNTICGNSICVGCIGSVGIAAIVKGRAATNQQINSITNIRKDFDIFYIYYLLINYRNFLRRLADSSTSVPILSKKDFSNIKFDMPNIIQQKNISKILCSIDYQIEKNNAMIKSLQVLAHAIFNRYFKNENKTVSLMNFPYIELLKPGITKFSNQKHYLATSEVNGENINFNAPLIDFETRENRANMQPISNSIWFAKLKNSIKHIYITERDEIIKSDYIFSTGFCGFKCEDFAFEYLVHYINLSYFELEKDILSHGATQEGISNEDLKSFKIHLPSREKLISFHNKVKDLHIKISEINGINFKLNTLKITLLPLLINGQLQ